MSSPIFPLALRGTDLVPIDDLKISIASPSAQYGHGVFEGIMAYPATGGGMNIVALWQHMARLFASAQAVFPQIAVPVSIGEAVDGICRAVRDNGVSEQVYIRPSLLLPIASDIHLNPVGGPSEFVFSTYVQRSGAFRQPGMDCVVSPFRKPNATASQHKLSGLYAYLNMASAMAGAAGYDEGILLDEQGFVAEGVYQNIMVQWHGMLLEPRRHGRPILPSITATVIKRLLRFELPDRLTVREHDLTPRQLCEAEAVMLVGTASEVSFIRRLGYDGLDHVIGDGNGTPLVRRLIDLYAAFVRGQLGHDDLLVHV